MDLHMNDPPEMMIRVTMRSVACRSDNQWGWRPEAMPSVIEAAERADLPNIGGQLQFLTPDGICECYWVEVDALAMSPRI
jgi:hypothetical protein